MKTDSLFYALFQTAPSLLFDLLGEPAQPGYTFTSVEVKQTAFRIDGLFLPTTLDAPIYLVEVQFQHDPEFYGRLFGEFFLYLRQFKARYWRVVVLFANRSIEPDGSTYQLLLDSSQVHRIYLSELDPGDKLGLKIVQLIVSKEQEAFSRARNLFPQVFSLEAGIQSQVIELIETILVYKFPRLSREELRQMLNLDNLTIKETRYYQEAKEEGKLEGKFEGKLEGKLESVPALAARGFSLQEIAEILNLAPEQVRSVL